jgi:2-phosphosulfolactate phosphatase
MLPSPNGSRLSMEAGSGQLIAGCFRNAAAVARTALSLAAGGDIAVIPAGERWPDGSLRPAVEDLLGAGAIINRLDGLMDAEARVARETYRAVAADLDDVVRACLSGQQLIRSGFEEDVELALQSDVSSHAPVMTNGAYARWIG